MCCWMTIKTPTDDESALDQAVDAVRRHEDSNGHSWGIALAIDGEILIQKGVGYMTRSIRALDRRGDADIALGHTRYATRGVISGENAHPFPIYNADGDIVAALAHNGTWHEAPTDDTDRCDSYFIAKELEQRYQENPDRPFAEHIRATGDYVGETIAVIHRDGRGWVYAGRFTICADAHADTSDETDRGFIHAADLSDGTGALTDGGDDHGENDPALRLPAEGHPADWTTDAAASTGGMPIPDGDVVRLGDGARS